MQFRNYNFIGGNVKSGSIKEMKLIVPFQERQQKWGMPLFIWHYFPQTFVRYQWHSLYHQKAQLSAKDKLGKKLVGLRLLCAILPPTRTKGRDLFLVFRLWILLCFQRMWKCFHWEMALYTWKIKRGKKLSFDLHSFYTRTQILIIKLFSFIANAWNIHYYSTAPWWVWAQQIYGSFCF